MTTTLTDLHVEVRCKAGNVPQRMESRRPVMSHDVQHRQHKQRHGRKEDPDWIYQLPAECLHAFLTFGATHIQPTHRSRTVVPMDFRWRPTKPAFQSSVRTQEMECTSSDENRFEIVGHRKSYDTLSPWNGVACTATYNPCRYGWKPALVTIDSRG